MHRKTFLLLASALAAGLAAAAAAERRESVKLHAGGHAVSRTGSVEGHDTVSYSLHATKGERLEINFNSTHGSCKFDLYAPGMAVPMFLGVAPASAFTGTLPESGEYHVNVKLEPAGRDSCGFDVRFRLRD